MDIKKVTDANRIAWNEVTPKHQAGRETDLKEKFKEAGYTTFDKIESEKLLQVGVDGKQVAQVCCNNGRETLSLVNLGAASAVGFDISDEAIIEASELAEISGLNVKFVRTDVYDIGSEYDNQFDLIYLTIGAITWLPNLSKFFEILSRMLKPGGDLLMYEMHPFLYMMALDDDKEYDPEHLDKIAFSYFKTEPWIDETGLDYVGNTKYKSAIKYSFTQKISDIINPIISNGLNLKELVEYPHDICEIFKHLEKYETLPMSFHLWARKN